MEDTLPREAFPGIQAENFMSRTTSSLKQKAGALVFDLPRLAWSLRPEFLTHKPARPWVFMRNRNELLISDDQSLGVRCNWKWTSDLHIAKVFPALGLRLMKRALRNWPIELHNAPGSCHDEAEVSFIIGHRGKARLPHLLSTLQSIASQRDISFECLVVEQSHHPEIREALPEWVRYIYTPVPEQSMPYCRSWAFNVGARAAKGELLVLHDNDMLVPQGYASQLLARFKEGYEVMNLKRVIFYLTEAHSGGIYSANALLLDEAPEVIVQNLEAGGSVAASKRAYFEIGGFDESFIGWGGEDNEFWERAQTRKVWPYGYLPIVHLWHSPQQGKIDQKRATAALFEERSKIRVEARIKELSSRAFGNPVRLSVPAILRADCC